MLRSILRPAATLAATAGLFYLALAAAQPPAPQAQPGRPPTIEERVAALERGLASVTTRFELREAAVAPTPPSGAALESRLSGVERTALRSGLPQRPAARSDDGARVAAAGHGRARGAVARSEEGAADAQGDPARALRAGPARRRARGARRDRGGGRARPRRVR